MKNAANGSKVRVERAWATGNYGTAEILLGKLPYVTNVDNGMIFDDNISGVQVNFGNEKIKATVTAGRMNIDPDAATIDMEMVRNYAGIEVYNDRDAKITWGLAYHNLDKKEVAGDPTEAKIWEIGAGYKFTNSVALNAAYAQNTKMKNENSKMRKAYTVQLDYKGADQAKPGSYGSFAAYRHLGGAAILAPTYDAFDAGFKGWEIGTDITLDKNIVATAKYGRGKSIEDSDIKKNIFFSEVKFFF